jgi:GNAT superfamily N-acetyltransferase
VTDLDILPTRFLAPAAQTLVAAALGDLSERYGGGPGDATPIEAMEFDPPVGGFFVAWRDGEAVGCGGWRSHVDADAATSDGVAELKRMYVAPQARGTGVATEMLAAIERSALRYGRTRMILECGFRQPEAIALYEKLGYVRIPDFGFYRDKEGVRSYGRDLAPRADALTPAPSGSATSGGTPAA